VDDVVSGRPPCAEWDHVLSGGGMELQNYGEGMAITPGGND
jgi:hypothetical protein